MRVLFVSDAPEPHAGRRVPDVHADTELADALRAAGVDVVGADWSAVARGEVALDGVDLIHLRPAVLRRGPRSGDRRESVRRIPFSWRPGPWRPDQRHADADSDRRTGSGLLAHVPAGLPIVLTLPARPAGPVAVRPAPALVPVEVVEGPPGARPVHVIAADARAAAGLAAVLPDTYAASVAVIGRGFSEPRHARAFDVDAVVVLASTAPGSSAEAAAVLRAVEMLGHAGLRLSLVLAGVGPTVRGVQRRVALAESAGIDVRLLGRASADELARWRSTAAVCVVASGEPGAAAELADLLLSGVPVVAALDAVHAEVAAQTSVLPGWFTPGDAAGLATALREQLGAASAGRGDRRKEGTGSVPGRDLPGRGDPGREDPGRRLAVLDGRVLPTWDDIAAQTRWVYEQAVRARRG